MLESLSSLEDVQNIYDWFAEMRDNQPVWLDPASGCWHVFRYDDVLQVTRDTKKFSSERPRALRRPPFNSRSANAPSLLAMDPPEHRQYRNLVSSAFTPRALESLAPRIRNIVQELLDRVRPNGHMDLITDLAYPFPATVIAEMLGAPIEDRPLFKRWADALLSRQLSDSEIFHATEEDIARSPAFQEANRAMEEMWEYFETMLDQRRLNPRPDMMSDLLTAEIDGEKLSQDEVISFCTLLLLAGHVTTTTLLGQTMLCLDAHPAAMKQLRNQPELVPGALEEVLRFSSPVWRLIRVSTETAEVGGTQIPPQSIIFAWLASANRDERQFTEPETFDIMRSPNRHLAFGQGIHFCLGAPLARMESSIALPMMLEQLPQLRRDRTQPVELLASSSIFGIKHLPVTFTPRRVLQKTGGRA